MIFPWAGKIVKAHGQTFQRVYTYAGICMNSSKKAKLTRDQDTPISYLKNKIKLKPRDITFIQHDAKEMGHKFIIHKDDNKLVQ